MATITQPSPKALTWLHLSDFHTGKDGYAQKKLFKRILTEVEDRAKSRGKPDFVFITGDLADKGKAEEFSLFNDEFIVPLIDLLGIDHVSRVFIIPGNHDVDRRKAKSVRRYDVLQQVPSFLDPTSEGLEERRLLLPRFEAFEQCDWMLDNVKWVSSEKGYLAKQLSVGDQNVGILCVNTAWFCEGEEDRFRLTPGWNVIDDGLNELSGCKPVFVLGHHPLDWLVGSEANKIRSCFAKYGSLYLHGHLHKSDHANIGNAASNCLTIQAGCSFSTRADDQWATRILWGLTEPQRESIDVEPKTWVPDHQNWALDTLAFPEALRVGGTDFWRLPIRLVGQQDSPRTKQSPNNTESQISAPEGWTLIDAKFLEEHAVDFTEERILQYFNGRVPMWEDILLDRIPKRAIVADLVNTITEAIHDRRPQITLLAGAGGEGKSTAFLQVLHEFARRKTVDCILWRSNSERHIPADFVRALSTKFESILVASDEAEFLVKDIFECVRALQGRREVHFFLACRDTDWIDAEGDTYAWNQFLDFVERKMTGLDNHDAEAIVDAWGRLGPQGLGKLAGLEKAEAVQKLLEAAKLEASASDGAFLGAMLRVRVGLALKDHVAALLARLNERVIQGLDKTLLDAFAYIAIPHAKNFLFLSKPVLARVLGLDETRVRRRVLGPLGEEAAAAAYGQSILTRHRAIAEAATGILNSRFHFDEEDVLVELVRAAIQANGEGIMVPRLVDWRYLSTRVFEEGSETLGVKLAATALAADPANSFLAVKLAQLFRESGQPEHSADVFRKSAQSASGNRAFFTEWATCEGKIGNGAVSIWLKALSLADSTELRPPDMKDVCFGLAGCAISFVDLHERYLRTEFLQGGMASASLGLRLKAIDATAGDIFFKAREKAAALGMSDLDGDAAFAAFEIGVRAAYEQRELNLEPQVPSPIHLKYNWLKRSLGFKVEASEVR